MSAEPRAVPVARPSDAWTPLTGTAHVIALEVLLDGPLPRSELARRLDLSAGSLTRLSKPLLDSGLLVEMDSGYGAASGRPTRPLDVDERSHHFVGVKLTADTAYAVLTTLRASVLAAEETPLLDRTPAAVVSTVAALVRSLAEQADGVDLRRRPRGGDRARRARSTTRATSSAPATWAGRRSRSGRRWRTSWACRWPSTTTCCR